MKESFIASRNNSCASSPASRQGSPHPRGRSQKKEPQNSAEKSPARSPTANTVTFVSNGEEFSKPSNIVKGKILSTKSQKSTQKTAYQFEDSHPTTSFNLDTGSFFNLIPLSVAHSHNLEVKKIENEAISVKDIQGNKLPINGISNILIVLTGSNEILSLDAIVTSGLSTNDVVIGLESMMHYQMLPANWPRHKDYSIESTPADQLQQTAEASQQWFNPSGAIVITTSQLLTLAAAVAAISEAREYKDFFGTMSRIDICQVRQWRSLSQET